MKNTELKKNLMAQKKMFQKYLEEIRIGQKMHSLIPDKEKRINLKK